MSDSTDLRALLGDRYDEVLTAATKASLFAMPHLPIGIEGHEVMTRAALAAVLPEFLTKLAEAEDRARRFAQRLSQVSTQLTPALAAESIQQRAEAWDEGFLAWQHDGPDAAPNPYREAGR